MEIGIVEAHSVLGSRKTRIEELTEDDEVQQTIRSNGLREVCIDNDRIVKSMIEEVFCRFQEKPDYIILAHSLPYLLGNSCLCEDMMKIPLINLSGTPCCIMHQAVLNAISLIRSEKYKKVLIIGVDKCYINYERIFFGTAMSDSAVGIMLSGGADENIICGTKVNTYIIASNGVYSDEKAIAKFRGGNPTFIRNVISECLHDHNYSFSDLDYVVCHTSNRGIWDQVSALTRMVRDKFLDINISKTGHMNSNDSFFHYLDFVNRGIIKSGQLVALVNPGFGGSQGCTLIKR